MDNLKIGGKLVRLILKVSTIFETGQIVQKIELNKPRNWERVSIQNS